MAEISYLDTSQHYLQLFYWSLGQEISSSPILRPFLDLTAVNMRKNDFSQKVFEIHASNFPEMFIGSLSTTFVKTVWWFLHIDASQIKKTAISYKKNHFFLIFSKNTVDTGFKLSRNVYQMIIYNFSIDTMLGKSRFLDLTAVNMWKKQFLAIFSTFFQLFTTFYNFLQRFTTFHKLLQLFNNF